MFFFKLSDLGFLLGLLSVTFMAHASKEVCMTMGEDIEIEALEDDCLLGYWNGSLSYRSDCSMYTKRQLEATVKAGETLMIMATTMKTMSDTNQRFVLGSYPAGPFSNRVFNRFYVHDCSKFALKSDPSTNLCEVLAPRYSHD